MQFSTQESDIAAAANEALKRFKDESRKQFCSGGHGIQLPHIWVIQKTAPWNQERETKPEKCPITKRRHLLQSSLQVDWYVSLPSLITNETYRMWLAYKLIISGSNVSAYINMLFDSLRNSLPKTVIYYQVREAMISLNFSTLMSIGKR